MNPTNTTQVQAYVANDGSLWLDETECLEHNQENPKLPLCMPESLRSLLEGGIPVKHLLTVRSVEKLRNTASLLNGISSGAGLTYTPMYLRYFPYVDLES